MSLNRHIFFGAAASWAGRGVTILLGLVLMPVLFRHMPKEELGIWLLLGQSWAVLGILDLGFGVTLSRRVAFAKGRHAGADRLELNDAARAEIANLMATGSAIYKGLAGLAFAVSFGLGVWYLSSMTLVSVSYPSVLIAWAVLCGSQAVNVLVSPWTCMLQGVGYVGWDALLSSLVTSIVCLSQIAAAVLGGGLTSLAVISAAGALVQRALILLVARKKCPDLFQLQGRGDRQIFLEMLPLAWRAWLTSIGVVIVSNTDQFVIASREGAGELPAYRAAFLLLINLHLLAGVFSGASQVFVSQLWASHDLAQIRVLLRRNTLIGLLTLGCGGSAILGLGSTLFDLWLGPGNFIGEAIVGTFLATFLLEHHASVFATVGRATDDEAYVLSSLVGAALKIVFAIIGVQMFGLLGLAASTLLAQAFTNSWFMVYRTTRRVKLSFSEHMARTLRPCLFFSLLSLAVSLSVSHWMNGQSLWLEVAAVSSCSGMVLGVALWFFVITPSQRQRVCRRLRAA